MAIRVGRGLRTGRKALPPRNHNMSHVAQQRLDNVVSRANQQLQNALTVDGFDIYIWSKKRQGNICTCQKHTEPNFILPKDNKDHDFSSPVGKPNDMWELRRGQSTPATSQDQFFKQISDWKTKQTDELFSHTSNETQSTQILSEETSLLKEDSNSGVLFGNEEKTTCGICFGYGWVDAWQLHKGQRIVLDYTKISKRDGFSTTENLPKSLKAPLRKGCYVEWELNLPSYFKEVKNVTIRNNLVEAKNIKLQYNIGNGWYDFNTEILNSLNGALVNPFKIRAIPIVDSVETNYTEFTHIEIYYLMASMPKAQIPNFSLPVNFEIFDALVQTQMEVGADVDWIDREYVIGDSKHNLLWKVTEVTPKLTSRRQNFGFELSVRIIQKSEQLYLLNLLTKKTVQLNFRGLEQIQGIVPQGVSVIQEPRISLETEVGLLFYDDGILYDNNTTYENGSPSHPILTPQAPPPNTYDTGQQYDTGGQFSGSGEPNIFDNGQLYDDGGIYDLDVIP